MLFDDQLSLFLYCPRQSSAASWSRLPVLSIYIGCWMEASKSVKDESHAGHKSSAEQPLALHTLSFSSLYVISSWTLICISPFPLCRLACRRNRLHCSLSSSTSSPPSLSAAHCFRNIPCNNCFSCFNVFSERELCMWRKSFALVSPSSVRL